MGPQAAMRKAVCDRAATANPQAMFISRPVSARRHPYLNGCQRKAAEIP